VEFQPHPNSLDGSAKPMDKSLQKWGFLDIITALAETTEAIQNPTSSSAPKQSFNKEELSTLVEEVVAKENSKLCIEFQSNMSQMKDELQNEAKSYANKIDHELRGALTNLESILCQSMQVVKNLARLAINALEPSSPPN